MVGLGQFCAEGLLFLVAVAVALRVDAAPGPAVALNPAFEGR